MRDRNRKLRRRERARERGVDVTAYNDEVGTLISEDALESNQRVPGLLGVRTRAHPQEVIGSRKAEVDEDVLRHALVVMLTGVDYESSKSR